MEIERRLSKRQKISLQRAFKGFCGRIRLEFFIGLSYNRYKVNVFHEMLGW